MEINIEHDSISTKTINSPIKNSKQNNSNLLNIITIDNQQFLAKHH